MAEDNVEIEDPKAVLDALERYKKENKKFREERDAALARVDELESDDAAEKWKRRTVESEVKNRLMAAGVKDTDRLIKYVDVEGVDVGEDDSLTGIDDAIKALKEDFPELFDPKRQVGGKGDTFADNPANTQKSTSEMQAERLLGTLA